ncbi:MAG: oligopeptide transporter, OPT family [Deltaproteobacteria bacterium]|nr:oligopeptide transporter, OPT family [Deltaproteobacteria bacterium]
MDTRSEDRDPPVGVPDPYVPADKSLPELTLFSVVAGVALALVFAAGNAYLGLRVGMTVSASIPCAVISMTIMRTFLRRQSILENNMVQTIGSAGECLAAGSIFTIPALFLWQGEWGGPDPDHVMIAIVAAAGGLLGILFTIPLRRSVVIRERDTLPFPEGTACAGILLAGEAGGSRAFPAILGFLVSMVYAYLSDGLKLYPSELDWSLPGFRGTGFGMSLMPALLGVGYIIGLRISVFLFSGAALGWFIVMPAIYIVGSQFPGPLYPATLPMKELEHWGLWSNYIRFIGAGLIATGGIIGVVLSMPMFWRSLMGRFRRGKDPSGAGGGPSEAVAPGPVPRTDRDIPFKVMLSGIVLVTLVLGLAPRVPMGLVGAVITAVLGLALVTVIARIVGLVGASNAPISGMTIAALFIVALLYKFQGGEAVGRTGMIASICSGAVVCAMCGITGDITQDLKTGNILGATPWKQQLGEIIGVLCASVAIGSVLVILHTAWGFGSRQLPAPQATLMKLVVEGVMGESFPAGLVFSGTAACVLLTVLRLPALPIAIGFYLPIHISTPLLIGGGLRLWAARVAQGGAGEGDSLASLRKERGILFASGLIAGEGLIGILFAILAVTDTNIALGPEPLLAGWASTPIAFALLTVCMARVVFGKGLFRRSAGAGAVT